MGMVTDIPLPTVQLGLATFAGLEMIDQDGAVAISKNWSKYQSEDKLEARRGKGSGRSTAAPAEGTGKNSVAASA